MSTGIVERVTIGGSFIKYSNYGGESIKQEHECPDHKEAIKLILNAITNEKPAF